MKLEPHMMETQPGRATRGVWLGLLALTVFGGALRFYDLGGPSFWIDELFTVKWAAASLNFDFPLTRWLAYAPQALGLWLSGVDIGQLPYTPKMRANAEMSQWLALGVDEFTVRLTTAVIGTVTIFLLGWQSLRMMSARAALILTALLALSTWHLWMSQTARFYPQQFLFYNLSLLFYFDASLRKARTAWVLCGVFLVLSFATQLTSLMLLGVFAIDGLAGYVLRDQRKWTKFGFAALAVTFAACVVVYLPELLNKDINPTKGFVGSSQSLPTLVLSLPFMLSPVLFVLGGCSLVWVWRQDRRLAVLLGAACVLPLVSIACCKLVGIDSHVRYVFVSLYAWLAVSAMGLAYLYDLLLPRAGRLAAAAPVLLLAVVMLLGDFAYFTGGYGYRERWRDAFAYVQRHRAPGDTVCADFIPSVVGKYYLQDADVVEVKGKLTREKLAEYGSPTWYVTQDSVTQWQKGGPDEHMDLREYYSARVLEPYDSINVYYHPGGQVRGASDE